MKKVKRKRIIALILLMSMCFCGCGVKEQESNVNSVKSEKNWQDSRMSLINRYEFVSVTSDIICGCYEENEEIKIICHDKNNGEIKNKITLSNISYVKSMDVDENGSVYIVGVTKEDKTELWKIDEQGTNTNIGGLILEDTKSADYITPKGLYVDDKGYFYIWYEMGVPLTEVLDHVEEKDRNVYGVVDRIYVKDQNFNTLFYEQVANFRGSQILNFFLDDKGTPTIISQDIDNIYIQEIDIDKGGLSEETKIENNQQLLEGIEIVSLLDNGFLFLRGSMLYEYSYDTQVSEEVLNLASFGILASEILHIEIKENQIEIIDNYGKEHTEYTILTEGESKKKVITLGVMLIQNSPELERAIAEFNRYNEDIRVEVISYYDEQAGFDASVEQLKLDIMRGEAPDVIEVSNFDYNVFVNKGVLVDLYEYMQDDKECNTDMLISSVMKVYEIDGHLYSIAPTFQLYSIWGNPSIINKRSGLTLKEMIHMLEMNGKTINAIYGFSADESVLTTLCTFGMDEFIDWNNGTCDFTGEYFEELLSFAKEYNPDFSEGSLSQHIQEDKIVMSLGIIDSVADYQVETKLYGGDLDVAPPPTANGSGTAVGFQGNQLAINANSDNCDEAWKFVKYYLLNGYNGENFPVITEQFEEMIKKAKEPDIVSSVDGSYEAAKGSYYDKDTYIEVFAAQQEDVDAIRKLIEEADNRYKYNIEILNIINEEASAYFAEQKELEDVTKIIQSRVELYLQENR